MEFVPEEFEGVLKIDQEALDWEMEHLRDEWERTPVIVSTDKTATLTNTD
jgi:hypothetical protein